MSAGQLKARLVWAAFGVPLLAFLAFCSAVRWWPYPVGLDKAPAPGTWIEDRNGRPLAAFVAENDQWHLPLKPDQFSPHLLKAIVAVEDHRFFHHCGVDWSAIGAACWQNLTALRVRRGASTVTMQVQRLRDPRPRTLATKVVEAVRACQLEQRHGKQALLGEYLNRAPFGGNLVGAGAASWRYFGRACRDLSLGQAALLAGLPQNPHRFRPDQSPQRTLARRNHVLNRMLACGMITPTQHDHAQNEPLDAVWRPLPQTCVAGALPTLAWLAERNPGRTTTATLDAAIQRQVAMAAVEQLKQLAASGVSAAAVVVLDTPTAECLAAASLSHDAADVDLTRRARSTGSVLKPFIYAAAFEAGICTAKTVLRDSPAAWPGYVPANYDHQFRGELTAAEALAESRNIPAMILLANVGVSRAIGAMEAVGLRTLARSPQRYGVSLAIGGAEATPQEVAEAYATLARGGIHAPVRFVRSCDDCGISDLKSQIPNSSACWQTLHALNASERTAAICPEAADLRVAWKTGTSSGHRDAWCAAVTPRRTVVVWLGNATGQASESLVGAEAAAPLTLRLIASLDHGGESWPAVDVPATPLTLAQNNHRVRPPSQQLTLVSPADRQEIVFSADEPVGRQQVSFKAAGRRAEKCPLWWFVDGQPIAVASLADQVWWSPTPGTHEVRVASADGQAAMARIRVRKN